MNIQNLETGLNDLVNVLDTYFTERKVISENSDLKTDIIQTRLKEFDGENFGKMFNSANGLLKMIEDAETELETATRREKKAYSPEIGSIEEVGYYLKRQEWQHHYTGNKPKMESIEKDYRTALVDSDFPKVQFIEEFVTFNPDVFEKFGLYPLQNKMAFQVEENRNKRLTLETQKLAKRINDFRAIKNRAEQVQNVTRHRNMNVLRDALSILKN